MADCSITIAKVTQANVLATWQDLGRRHSTHHGVGQGGAMDMHAACWANRLLSRDINQPVIEITMGFFAIEFQASCQIAITGADMNTSLNGKEIEPWHSYAVNVGDQLKFSTANTGFRAYLAINAELQLETVFNSVSTVIREGFSGLLGRSLRINDEIIGLIASLKAPNKKVPNSFIPDYCEPLTLELIPSYQFDQFPQRSIDGFLKNEYQIQSSSNRMAYLLKGNPTEHSLKSLVSQGIAYGTVQVPPDGQPVILLNDRQTMGGYPSLGCISRLSGNALAQKFAPSNVRFRLTSLDSEKKQYKEFFDFLCRT